MYEWHKRRCCWTCAHLCNKIFCSRRSTLRKLDRNSMALDTTDWVGEWRYTDVREEGRLTDGCLGRWIVNEWSNTKDSVVIEKIQKYSNFWQSHSYLWTQEHDDASDAYHSWLVSYSYSHERKCPNTRQLHSRMGTTASNLATHYCVM